MNLNKNMNELILTTTQLGNFQIDNHFYGDQLILKCQMLDYISPYFIHWTNEEALSQFFFFQAFFQIFADHNDGALTLDYVDMVGSLSLKGAFVCKSERAGVWALTLWE